MVLVGGRTVETRMGKERDRTSSALLTGSTEWLVGHETGRKGRPGLISRRKVPAHTSARSAQTTKVSEGRDRAGVKFLESLVALWVTDSRKWELAFNSFYCR